MPPGVTVNPTKHSPQKTKETKDSMSATMKNESNYIGYEYRDISVNGDMESLYVDSYECFGWQFEGRQPSLMGITSGTVILKFKRDRKVLNKAELTRLQRHFDSCVSEITRMEQSKTNYASVVAFTIGIIGTAFMAGAVFSYLANLIVLCIVLAVPAFVGWIVPYFAYLSTFEKKKTKVAPLIESKYDEIYEVCEKANGLLYNS